EVTNLQCDYLEMLQKCKCLEKELSKSKMMSKSFETFQKHAISLELELQQCKEKIKHDTLFKVNQSNDFREEREQYVEIQDLKAQLQDKGIAKSELKKLIEKLKRNSVDTKFEKSSVVREPNAFKRMYKLHTEATQTRTSQLPNYSRETNKRVSFSTSEIPTTSVSRLQLKSNPMEDSVMLNNSQRKKHEVEDYHRNVKFSINNTSVTACSHGTNLYSITLQGTTSPNPICFMAKASSSQAWLWHRRLSHLNFDTINLLSKNDIMVGLPKLKFIKDHLYSSCELGKAKRKSFHTKISPSSKRWLQLLHMDLCGPMRVASINGKRYVLIIVDDYSRYTWTHFLRSKDETPEVLIDFLRLVQRGLHAQVRIIQIDKGTEFLNQSLHAYFAAEGILY
nr:retrovirus-related Pol polyprotein from transposon TNT 1-94 [Tanacetum cinerariifolium]